MRGGEREKEKEKRDKEQKSWKRMQKKKEKKGTSEGIFGKFDTRDLLFRIFTSGSENDEWENEDEYEADMAMKGGEGKRVGERDRGEIEEIPWRI